MSLFNVSLLVQAKSQDRVHKPQFLKRKESRSGSNLGPSAYQPSALPLGHTGSSVVTNTNAIYNFQLSGDAIRTTTFILLHCQLLSTRPFDAAQLSTAVTSTMEFLPLSCFRCYQQDFFRSTQLFQMLSTRPLSFHSVVSDVINKTPCVPLSCFRCYQQDPFRSTQLSAVQNAETKSKSLTARPLSFCLVPGWPVLHWSHLHFGKVVKLTMSILNVVGKLLCSWPLPFSLLSETYSLVNTPRKLL